jgi:hypothetical protein
MIELIIVIIIALWIIVGGLVYVARQKFDNANLINDSWWHILAHGPSIWIARLSVKSCRRI